MPPVVVLPTVRLLPVKPLRAGMLAYLAVLAVIEIGAGVVVAEAWRAQHATAGVTSGLGELSAMLERLRSLESVVAAGAVASTVLWSFAAVRHATFAGRNRFRGWATVATWAGAPFAVMALTAIDHGAQSTPLGVVVLVAQSTVIALPFLAIGFSCVRIGGTMAPFLRWYCSTVLVFLVHEMFTGSLNLSTTVPTTDLGRTAALYLASGLMTGVMVVMAAEASNAMLRASLHRVQELRYLHAEALARFRPATNEPKALRPVEPSTALAISRRP